MQPNEDFGKLPEASVVNELVKVLNGKGINAFYMQTGAEAKEKVLEIVPQDAEVFTASSTTLQTIGLVEEVEQGSRYISLKNKLAAMDSESQAKEKRQLAAAPDWVMGSIHAVTKAGEFLIASNTGSQLPLYASGASNVVWVIGTQKIVENVEQGMKRLYEYCLPLENERALKAYGMPSAVNKILMINKEIKPGRINVVFVNEKVGF